MRPREPVGPEALPPPAPPWLRAAVGGVLAAALFEAPAPLGLLAPVPLLIAGRRHGVATAVRASVIGVLVAPVFATLLSLAGEGGGAIGAGLGFAFAVAAPALLLDRCLAWTGDASRAIEIAAASYLGVGFAVLGIAGAAAEGGAVGIVEQGVDESLEAYAASLQEQAEARPELRGRVDSFAPQRAVFRTTLVRLFPAAAAALVAVAFWLNVMYARWFVGGETEEDDLTRWRLPGLVMPLTMAVMTVSVLQSGLLGDLVPRIDAVFWPAMGGLLLLGVLYTLQGIAVVNWWFVRLRMSPFLRIAGVAAQVMVFFSAAVMFTAVGLTDAWFDLRKLDDEAGEER